MSSFLIVGHRGVLATEPENTFRSYHRAVELGVDVIELDVRLSRDNELVIMHDASVDRTTDGQGAVADLDWSELQALDAGAGERIPHLTEVLDTFPDMEFQIEVKAPAATDALLDALRARRGRGGAVTISSFRPDPLATALAAEDRCWRAGLICGIGQSDKIATANELGVDHLFVHWDIADHPGVAAFARERGPVDVWPSEDPETVQRAIRAGFAGTTTDDPAMAVPARDAALVG